MKSIATSHISAMRTVLSQASSQRAPSEDGVWQHPDGKAYYEYIVRHHTSSEMTPEVLEQIKRVEDIAAEKNAPRK